MNSTSNATLLIVTLLVFPNLSGCDQGNSDSEDDETPAVEVEAPANEDEVPADKDKDKDPDIEAAPDTPEVDGSGNVIMEPEDEAAYIYDQKKIHTFEIELTEEDLKKVNNNPAAEQYVPARLHFEGVTYDVGYRYKGGIGSFMAPCTRPLKGKKKAGKCSVKVSFNWSDPEGRIFGLKKLLFHSMNEDHSMLRERLGYSLFREMGVPAARATHAILKVNGETDIYALVEQIDGRFTRSRFTEGGKGNLYKEIWPIHDNPEAYIKALKTNEDENPSTDRIIKFKDATLSGPDTMREWIDHDIMVSYITVDRVIMHDDGPFHFYCVASARGNNPKSPGNHNYYWYEAKDVDHFWLIPWDLDHSFISMHQNEASNQSHLDWDWRQAPEDTKCGQCGNVLDSLRRSIPPSCDPVVQNFQAWIQDYEAKVDEFLEGPLSKAKVDAKIKTWQAQLEKAGYPIEEKPLSKLQELIEMARSNRGFPYKDKTASK